MRLKLFTFTVFILVSITIMAQQRDPVALTINGDPVYKSEVEQAFRESNARLVNKESLDEFLPRYIDYRCNLKEAKEQRLDQEESYKKEIANFKVRQANAYLLDTVSGYNFVKNIYDRLLEEREINHVLLPFDNEESFPSDTLVLYEKALELRNKLIKNNFTGEGYFSKEQLSTGIQFDNSLRNGYIGWVLPFMFPYPVENAIYDLRPGEISMPVRSVKGYHLVQLLDKRPSRGQLRIQQVHYSFSQIPPDKHQIDSVRPIAERGHNRIHSPEDYDALCASYSEQYGTGDKGCDFGLISLESQMPTSFINAVYNLKNVGDISRPVMTDFGFHIIRLAEEIPTPSFGALKPQLLDKIRFGDRLSYYNKSENQKLAQDYSLAVNKEAYKKLLALTETISPKNIDFIQKATHKDDILFTIDGSVTYRVKDFLGYLQSMLDRRVENEDFNPFVYKKNEVKTLSSDILEEVFSLYCVNEIKAYARINPEKRFPYFKGMISKYSDDLLIYDVKNKNIWNKAATDEAGLRKYFDNHKSRYVWNAPKYKGLVIHCKNEEALDTAKSLTAKTADLDELSSLLRKTLNSNIANVQIEKGLWAKGENGYVDNIIFAASAPEKKKGFPLFFVTGKLISSPQDFRDDRARVEADYQVQLEEQWNKYIKDKYKVEINQDVLKGIQ